MLLLFGAAAFVAAVTAVVWCCCCLELLLLLLLLLLLVVVIGVAVAVAVAVKDPSGCFLALREPPKPANYYNRLLRLAKYLVNYDVKYLQEAPKPKKPIL